MKYKWTSHLVILVFCTSVSMPFVGQAAAVESKRDPFEPMNRAVFQFNEVSDRWLLRPVAATYRDLAPAPVRKGVGNALRNLRDANYAVNALLQGRLGDALSNLGRFAINSTLGLVGTIDVATKSGLESTHADFGQTLARWGVHSGPFVMLPVIGPSTLRDGAALAVDAVALSVPSHIPSDDLRRAIWGTAIIHSRGQLVPLDDLITGDRYIFFRDAYLQRRALLLRNQARSGEATGVAAEVFGDFGDELAGEFEDEL